MTDPDRELTAPGWDRGLDESARRVVEHFTRFWSGGPDPAGLHEILADDVVLEQPMVRTVHGLADARRFFAALVRWLPGLRGAVHRVAATDGFVFIDWTMTATLGGRPFTLPIVDRIEHADGRIVHRRASYDSVRFVLSVLGRPSSWPGYARFVLSTR